MIKGVIFDMDGVIIDNHEYHFNAWMAFAKKYNFELNSEIYRDTFNGKTNTDLFNMIFGDISTDEIQKYSDEKEGLYQSLYAEKMKALPGLFDFLDFLKKRKIKIALGTSAPTPNVDFILDPLKLRHYFDAIVDGGQVSKGKPDPEIYLLCAMKLGLDPKDCVVFEDSFAGLESGERAGCKIVALATSHQAYELKSKTDLILHNFIDAKKILPF